MLAIPKPIAISNTGSSRHLRMAAAEAVFAKQLCERIFQPLYNLDSPVREELDDALEELFYKNPRQEAILRFSLLSAFVSEQQDHTKIVDSVVDDVCNLPVSSLPPRSTYLLGRPLHVFVLALLISKLPIPHLYPIPRQHTHTHTKYAIHSIQALQKIVLQVR